MKNHIKITIAAILIMLTGAAFYVDAKPTTKSKTISTKTKAAQKAYIKDPIEREYRAKIKDVNELTYAEPGSKIKKLHTPKQYIAKTINTLTKELFASKLNKKKKLDLQKRLRVLTRLKKEIK